jgi:hypothetical protein
MAVKRFGHDIDLVKQTLLNTKIHPLTTTAKTTLGATLAAGDAGLVVFDTTLNILQAWSGSAWVAVASTVSGSMVYYGTASSLTTIPTTTSAGSTYVSTVAGTLTWAGVTFSPSAVVAVGDMIVFRSSTQVDIIEGNAVQATETVSGISKVATQAITNTGTNDTDMITPLKLEQKLVNRLTPKAELKTALTFVANTALSITTASVMSNKDAFTVSFKDSTGEEISLQVKSVNTAGFTATSGIALTGVTAFITYI